MTTTRAQDSTGVIVNEHGDILLGGYVDGHFDARVMQGDLDMFVLKLAL